jgi:flagellar hook-associated protein 1 FlgK
MADLLSIGLSGLTANKTSLTVTGHNITNVNTPGYSRQDTVQVTRNPQFSGAGFIGSGTTLVDVRRTYNEFLTTQVRSSTALNGDVQAYLSQISQLDALVAGSTTGITPGMQRLFASLQTAAEDPANIPARQLVLSEAEGLAKRFNTMYDRLSEQNQFVNRQLSAVSDQVNQLAGAVAGYNAAISVASANGKPPNDLLDARDDVIRKLSEFIGVTVVAQDASNYNLFIGSGQPLVIGQTASRLEVVPGLSDPLRSEVQLLNGNSRQGITSHITGGEMGGLIRYREDVLDATFNSIGRLALVVSDQINSQLGQGLDIKGSFGEPLFRDINDAVYMQQRSLARPGNSDQTANLNVVIENASQLTTSDYQVEFTSATEYQIRRQSDGQLMSWDDDNDPLTLPVSTFTIGATAGPMVDGFSLSIAAGSFAAGDRFMINPTRSASSGIQNSLKKPEELAFALPLKSDTSPANIGSGIINQPSLITQIDIHDPVAQAALENSLRTAPPLRIVFTSESAYEVYDVAGTLVSNDTIVPGQNNTRQITTGTPAFTFEFTLSGRPGTGDNFTIAFNTNGVSDNRNALKLVDLQNRATVGINPAFADSTGASFTDAYGDLVERVGTLTSQARVDQDAMGAILKQATDRRDSVSAVSLDEEAAKLIQFEQYYQASAQIIQVARSLFDTLINSI